MKIAVFSDVHANKSAFEAVLKDIKNFKPDMIFCLGDLILAGYNPNWVCEQIFELKEQYKENFLIIQGNTDKMISNCTNELIQKTKESYPCMGYSLEDDVKITKKEYIEFVKNLKEKENITVNGLKIELVHGSPRKQNENMYPDMKQELIEQMVEFSNADLILCGHTHIPCGYTLDSGKTVINVGSVGRSMTKDKKAVYLQLTVDKFSKFFCEHRFIEYNIEETINHILSRNLAHCEDLVKMFTVK